MDSSKLCLCSMSLTCGICSLSSWSLLTRAALGQVWTIVIQYLFFKWSCFKARMFTASWPVTPELTNRLCSPWSTLSSWENTTELPPSWEKSTRTGTMRQSSRSDKDWKLILVWWWWVTGVSSHCCRPHPAHHLQRVPPHDAGQGGYAPARPRPAQGNVPFYCQLESWNILVRTGILTAMTWTPTPLPPMCLSPLPSVSATPSFPPQSRDGARPTDMLAARSSQRCCSNPMTCTRQAGLTLTWWVLSTRSV